MTPVGAREPGYEGRLGKQSLQKELMTVDSAAGKGATIREGKEKGVEKENEKVREQASTFNALPNKVRT